MKLVNRNQFVILELLTFCFALTLGAECGCSCRWLSRNGKDEILCKYLEGLSIEVEANKGALLNWSKYYSFVKRFSEFWRQDVEAIVVEQLENGVNPRFGDVKTTENSVPPTENPKFRDLEERLLAVENRAQDLENKLVEEQKIRKQLERDVEATRATLIDLTEQIMNLTSSAEIAGNMLPTIPNSPSLADGLGENLETFMRQLQTDLRKLRKIRSVNDFSALNSTLWEHTGISEDEMEVKNAAATKLISLEDNLRALNSAVGEISTKIQCVDCDKWPQKRRDRKQKC